MTGVSWLTTIIIGGIAGALAGRFMSGHGYGILADIIVGLVGGAIGGFVANLFNVSGSGVIFSFIVSLIGAVILLWLLRLVTGSRARI